MSAHKSEQRMVLRARIVLLAAIGVASKEIARELECDLHTVRKWRERFADSRLEGLFDLPRSGRPPIFTSLQKHQVLAMALSLPPFPLARWTLDGLCDYIMEQGIVTSLSRESVSYWLRTADIKPHRCRYSAAKLGGE